MNANVPVLNIAVALKRMSGDRELLKMLLMTFLEDAPRKIEKIRHLIKLCSYNEACIEAHALKGAASTVGADRLADVAAYMECELKNLCASDERICSHPVLSSGQQSNSAPADPQEALQYYLQFFPHELQRIEVRALTV